MGLQQQYNREVIFSASVTLTSPSGWYWAAAHDQLLGLLIRLILLAQAHITGLYACDVSSVVCNALNVALCPKLPGIEVHSIE